MNPKPYYSAPGVSLYHGDCRDVLPSLGDTFGVIVTDPPYGQSNEGYDKGVDPAVWSLCLDRATENAALLSFAGSPTYHRIASDIEAAGWWVWGLSTWIGGSWAATSARSLPRVAGDNGVHAASRRDDLPGLFSALSDRLKRVKVACGAWNRILGKSTMNAGKGRMTAVFLDPPYSHAMRDPSLYACEDADVARQVRLWCRVRGEEPNLRIALCGYEGDHDELVGLGWSVHAWRTQGGYGNQAQGRGRANAVRERIWFSPHCLT